MRAPRLYQLAMHEAVRDAFRKGKKRVVTELFTGAGKTVCFSLMAKMAVAKKGRVLIIVNRDVLVTQALQELAANGVHAQREQATDRASILADVVVGSIQSMQGKWLNKWAKDYFRLVVTDECHGSASRTFKNILDHFGNAYHCGVTATAERHDKRALWKGYEDIVFRMPLATWVEKDTGITYPGGQDEGWIVPFDFHELECPVTLDEKLMQHASFSENEEVFDSRKYLPRLMREAAEHLKTAKALLFFPNCRVSNQACELLRAEGINAQHIDSSYMKWQETERLLKWFAEVKVGTLSCCDLLAVGYNQPDINLIGPFRPIASTPMYKQRLGRGTRAIANVDAWHTAEERKAAIAASNKPCCRVLNVFWENGSHDLASPSCLITDDKEEQQLLKKAGKGMLPMSLEEMRNTLKAKRMDDVAEEMRKFSQMVANSQQKRLNGRVGPYIGDILKRYTEYPPASSKQLGLLWYLGCKNAKALSLTTRQASGVIGRWKQHKEGEAA